MIKVVIWMNMPSHHQMAFFNAIHKRNEIDLEVRYYDVVSDERKKLGWDDEFVLPMNQQYVCNNDFNSAISTLFDWTERIHIVPGFSNPFLKKLILNLITKDIKWIHWSERSGKPFTKLLAYNYELIDLLFPLFLQLKGYKNYAKKINKYAIGALANSKLAEKDFLKWGVNKEKIRILNYSIEGLKRAEQNPLADIVGQGVKIFMYSGVLTTHKGIQILLKAFSQLTNSENWKLVLIGHDKSNKKYEKSLERSSIKNSVYFAGTIPSRDMNLYMSQADVFVLPTLFDGWGAVLNEAASLGKPLISTSQCGAAHHLIKNNINGFRVKSKSVAELRDAMQSYIDDEEQMIEHGQQSYEIFLENSPEINVKIFYEHITELLNFKAKFGG